MADIQINAGAGSGPANLRQNVEVIPYATSYWASELYVGSEWINKTLRLPIGAVTPVAALAYQYTGGDDINRGSHRHAFFVRGGVRARFWDGLFTVDGLAGIGAAQNYLNFGKGVPLPREYSANGQLMVSAKFTFCLNANFCVGPKMAMMTDSSVLGEPGYSARHYLAGFDIQAQLVPETDEGKSLRQCEDTVVTLKKSVEGENTINQRKDEEIARLRERIEKSEVGSGSPANTVQAREISRLTRNIAERERIEYRWITTLPGEFLFQNNSTKIAYLAQEFKGNVEFKKQRLKCRIGNPNLDVVMRGVVTRLKNITFARETLGVRYQVILEIRGFANDTGPDVNNVDLANGRVDAVYHYLTQACGAMNAFGAQVGPLKPGENLKILKIYTADPVSDIINEVKQANPNISDNDLKTRIENPIWRMATITYKLMKIRNGVYKSVPFEEIDRIRGTRPSGGR